MRIVFVILFVQLVHIVPGQLKIADEIYFNPGAKVAIDKVMEKAITDREKMDALVKFFNKNFTLKYEPLAYLSIDVNKVFKQLSGSALEMAQLFATLANYYGLNCVVVNGFLNDSTLNFAPDLFFHATQHAWNAVRINNEWKVVDLTKMFNFLAQPVSTRQKNKKKWLLRPYLIEYKYSPAVAWSYSCDIDRNFPLLPAWQGLNVPYSYRSVYTKRELFFDLSGFNPDHVIAELWFNDERLRLEGAESIKFCDSLSYNAALGEFAFVRNRMMQYAKVKPQRLDDPKSRSDDYDNLSDNVARMLLYANQAKKIVSSDAKYASAELKKRQKMVAGENANYLKLTSKALDLDKSLRDNLESENDKFHSKSKRSKDKHSKINIWFPRIKEKGKPPSEAKMNAMLKEFSFNRLAISSYLMQNDSVLERFKKIDQDLYFRKEAFVDSALTAAKNATTLCDSLLTLNHFVWDVLYFKNRRRLEELAIAQFVIRDTLLKKILRSEKKLAALYYSGTNKAVKLLKTSGKLYYELSRGMDVDSLENLLLGIKGNILGNLVVAENLYNDLLAKNNHLLGWLKMDRSELKLFQKALKIERYTSDLLIKERLEFQTKKFDLMLDEMAYLAYASRKYKAQIAVNKRMLKEEISRRKKNAKRNK